MKDYWNEIKKLGGIGILTPDDIDDLSTQRMRVLHLMLDAGWHSGVEIVRVAGGSEGLRRLRECREIPGVTIERRRSLRRTFVYRLVHAPPTGQISLF